MPAAKTTPRSIPKLFPKSLFKEKPFSKRSGFQSDPPCSTDKKKVIECQCVSLLILFKVWFWRTHFIRCILIKLYVYIIFNKYPHIKDVNPTFLLISVHKNFRDNPSKDLSSQPQSLALCSSITGHYRDKKMFFILWIEFGSWKKRTIKKRDL